MARTPFNPFQLRASKLALPANAATGLNRALTGVKPASEFQDFGYTSFKEKQ